MQSGDKGINRPMLTSCYTRVKSRNRANPYGDDDDEFQLTICCLCPAGHEPIGICKDDIHRSQSFKSFIVVSIEVDLDSKGNPKGPIRGNQTCWLSNFEFSPVLFKIFTNNNTLGGMPAQPRKSRSQAYNTLQLSREKVRFETRR